MNKELYCAVLYHLQEAVQKKRPTSVGTRFLHRVNTVMHTVLPGQKFLIINRTAVVPAKDKLVRSPGENGGG